MRLAEKLDWKGLIFVHGFQGDSTHILMYTGLHDILCSTGVILQLRRVHQQNKTSKFNFC
jgi:hypothetical protein